MNKVKIDIDGYRDAPYSVYRRRWDFCFLFWERQKSFPTLQEAEAFKDELMNYPRYYNKARWK